ncbi:general secretion pathway protein GspK [Acidisoma sp.]|uniref:general secretion pathway protein GspK n=1 Tax=Acidisoma sp. TaxID=1872115 RepID=UPI003B00F12C
MTGDRKKDRRQAGFALLIVIWSLVLVSFILAHVLSAGRSEVELARNLRAAAEAEPVADGAVQNTIFHLLDRSPQHWPLQGRHIVALPGGVADVRIENVAGRIDPNAADAGLLDAALTLCGVSGNTMASLVQAIMAWRAPPGEAGGNAGAEYEAAGLGYAPPGAPFETSGEIGLVIGMTPALRACLLPHISVFQENETPSPQAADPFVMRALTLDAEQTGDSNLLTPDQAGDDAGGDPTVTITAVAMGRGGGHFTRRATIRLVPGRRGRPFRVLNWQSL